MLLGSTLSTLLHCYSYTHTVHLTVLHTCASHCTGERQVKVRAQGSDV